MRLKSTVSHARYDKSKHYIQDRQYCCIVDVKATQDGSKRSRTNTGSMILETKKLGYIKIQTLLQTKCSLNVKYAFLEARLVARSLCRISYFFSYYGKYYLSLVKQMVFGESKRTFPGSFDTQLFWVKYGNVILNVLYMCQEETSWM